MKLQTVNDGEPFVYPYLPKILNERIRRQQGLFLAPNYNNKSLTEILSTYGIRNGNLRNEIVFVKFTFTAKLIIEFLRKLYRLGLTTEMMYPGLDGFSKSLKFKYLDRVYKAIEVNNGESSIFTNQKLR